MFQIYIYSLSFERDKICTFLYRTSRLCCKHRPLAPLATPTMTKISYWDASCLRLDLSGRCADAWACSNWIQTLLQLMKNLWSSLNGASSDKGELLWVEEVRKTRLTAQTLKRLQDLLRGYWLSSCVKCVYCMCLWTCASLQCADEKTASKQPSILWGAQGRTSGMRRQRGGCPGAGTTSSACTHTLNTHTHTNLPQAQKHKRPPCNCSSVRTQGM